MWPITEKNHGFHNNSGNHVNPYSVELSQILFFQILVDTIEASCQLVREFNICVETFIQVLLSMIKNYNLR